MIGVFECQKLSPDCYDMINQSIEEATERSTTVTSSKSAGSRSSTTLRSDYLKIGYQNWQKEEDAAKKKDFLIARIQTLPSQFLYLRAIQGHSGDKCWLTCIARLRTDTERILPSTSTMSGWRIKFNSVMRNVLLPGGHKVQKTKTSSLLHNSGPDGGRKWHGWNPMRSWRNQGSRRHTKILGNAFKILYFGAIWSSPKREVLQFCQTRSRAVVLYNTLLAACIEKAECVKTSDELHSECATSRAEIEFAIWSTRSAKPRRKIILGNIKRFET